MTDGRVGHAELTIGDSVLMLADEFAEIGHVAAAAGASVRVEVPDVDATVSRALARGAELLRPVQDSGYGRGGTIRDPFGQRWLVSQTRPPPGPDKPGTRHGAARPTTSPSRSRMPTPSTISTRRRPGSGNPVGGPRGEVQRHRCE
jgi:Glyoxalase-like domain